MLAPIMVNIHRATPAIRLVMVLMHRIIMDTVLLFGVLVIIIIRDTIIAFMVAIRIIMRDVQVIAGRNNRAIIMCYFWHELTE